MNETISVVVSIYNISAYIGQCIESVINQTTVPNELILVDDGSTDDSGAICDKYSENHQFIRVIHQPNSGPSSARNTGISTAKSDYILFLDGDDWIDRKLIETYTQLLASFGECDYIHWRQTFVYPDGMSEVMGTILENKDVLEKSGKQVFIEHTNENECIWLGIRGLFRRQFLLDNEVFCDPAISYGEDEEFMIRVFFHAKRMLSNEFPGYYYRANRKGSLMDSFGLNKAIQQVSIYRRWKAWIDSSTDDKQFFSALSIEMNRRVWRLYARCSFTGVFNKPEKKRWISVISDNKKLFQPGALMNTQGKMHFLIRLFGIAKTTALIWTITSTKRSIKKLLHIS